MSYWCRTAILLAALSGLVFSTPASAQSEGEAADLRQITIRIPADATESQKIAQKQAFSAATRSITACVQIDAVAHQVKGEVVAEQQFPMRSLPPQLRDQLAGKPAGTVTEVFGEDDVYRVLIRC